MARRWASFTFKPLSNGGSRSKSVRIMEKGSGLRGEGEAKLTLKVLSAKLPHARHPCVMPLLARYCQVFRLLLDCALVSRSADVREFLFRESRGSQPGESYGIPRSGRAL